MRRAHTQAFSRGKAGSHIPFCCLCCLCAFYPCPPFFSPFFTGLGISQPAVVPSPSLFPLALCSRAAFSWGSHTHSSFQERRIPPLDTALSPPATAASKVHTPQCFIYHSASFALYSRYSLNAASLPTLPLSPSRQRDVGGSPL